VRFRAALFFFIIFNASLDTRYFNFVFMTKQCKCSGALTDRTHYEEVVLDIMLYSARLKETVARQNSAVIVAMARMIAETFEAGGKVLICGNGGSAADAQHLATELTIRYRSSVQRPALPAIALSTDTSALTAGANDLGYDAVFARLAEAYGREGDLLLGLSTSGNSSSVVNALDYARQHGMKTIALLGGDGGVLKGAADLEIIVPHSGSADRVQECHITIGHVIIDLVERLLGYCRS
jgi:D-sedoheptulose 7-phosphate isomerase